MRTAESAGPWLVVVLAVNGCFWWSAALLDGGGASSTTVLLHLLGAAAPCLVVALVLARPGEAVARRRLVSGLLALPGLRAPHLLFMLMPPGVALLVTIVVVATRLEAAPTWRMPEDEALGALLVMPLLVALSQEIVWRGFAQARLQARLDALPAALLVAVLWGASELALFAVPGTRHAALGFGTAAFTLHLASLLPLAVVLASVFNATRGSVLATTAVHGSVVVTGVCVELGPAAELIRVACWSAVALGLLARYGPATLSSAPARRRRGDRVGPGSRRRHDVDLAALAPERTFTP